MLKQFGPGDLVEIPQSALAGLSDKLEPVPDTAPVSDAVVSDDGAPDDLPTGPQGEPQGEPEKGPEDGEPAEPSAEEQGPEDLEAEEPESPEDPVVEEPQAETAAATQRIRRRGRTVNQRPA